MKQKKRKKMKERKKKNDENKDLDGNFSVHVYHDLLHSCLKRNWYVTSSTLMHPPSLLSLLDVFLKKSGIVMNFTICFLKSIQKMMKTATEILTKLTTLYTVFALNIIRY